MEYGRLIQVGDRRDGTAEPELYVVAEPDAVLAQALVRKHIGDPTRAMEDIGKVTPALLTALNLPPGQFSRVSGGKAADADIKEGSNVKDASNV